MRRRLSYANVMATLAFFFALTGASIAGVKYIRATDTIPSTSDLAGSTYENPLIAPGKVTTGKIADGAITSAKLNGSAVAPNSLLLDGHGPGDFPKIVGTGSLVISDSSPITGCAGRSFEVTTTANTATDYVVVQATPPVHNEQTLRADLTGEHEIVLTICDPGEVGRDLDGTYRYMILRP